MSKVNLISVLRDMAQDADRWITINGAHVPLKKNGEPGGAVGRKLKQAGKSFADYRKEYGGDHYRAAREFYKRELMGKPVKAEMGELGEHEVHFTGAGLKKLQQNMRNEPTKALLVEHLPSVINEGKYIGETAPHKERNDFVSFHHF